MLVYLVINSDSELVASFFSRIKADVKLDQIGGGEIDTIDTEDAPMDTVDRPANKV